MALIRYEDVEKAKKERELNEVESLAMVLHEAGRQAVETGATVAAEKFGEATRKFLEWNEISEVAREGRRIQARYILARFYVISK